MAGDYTRFTDDPRRRFSSVLMQQGRVQLDADWNEAVEIVQRSVRMLALDTFGRVGLPLLTTPDAFLIGFLPGPPPDLSIEAGRLYVDGILAELFPDETVSYLAQPFLPDPPPLPAAGGAVVYLDVWRREVTWVEEPRLLDVALGGVDTTTRTQTVWQVRVEARDGAACGVAVGAPPSAGRLSTEAIAPPTPDDPCILPPLAGYRGLENRLYRVEIHTGGALGTARFKWSRDNGSIVSPVRDVAVAGGETTLTVDRIGRDPVLRFRIDDWVTVTDDHRELHGEPGEMARVIDIDEARGELVLDRALPAAGGRAFGATANDLAARHTRVQRWDETAATNTIDADGLIVTAAGPIDLEDGIRVRFDVEPAGGAFRVGDYWVFAARTADASVEILQQAPPRGIVHHYVQLAAVTGLGTTTPQVSDCRPRPQDGTDCCCCLVTVGAREEQRADFTDLAGAIAALPNLAPDESRHVIVCLLEGDHELRGPVVVRRPRVTIRGCGWGTRLLPREGPALVLEGPEQVLEDVWILAEQKAALVEVLGAEKRIERCRLEHQGSEPALRAQKAEDLVIRRNLILARGGIELMGAAARRSSRTGSSAGPSRCRRRPTPCASRTTICSTRGPTASSWPAAASSSRSTSTATASGAHADTASSVGRSRPTTHARAASSPGFASPATRSRTASIPPSHGTRTGFRPAASRSPAPTICWCATTASSATARRRWGRCAASGCATVAASPSRAT